MKRFLPWLVPIVVLLAAIPVLLMGNVATGAKIAGVVMVVLTTVAVRFWLYNANKLRTRGGKVKLTVNERYFLDAEFPLYKRLSGSEKSELEERAGILLAEIAFDRFDGKDVGKEECLAFAFVLALVVSGQPYRNCQKKIVVFREGMPAELTFQEESPVLFVSETDLKQLLNTVHSLEAVARFPQETREILQRFYELQERHRK